MTDRWKHTKFTNLADAQRAWENEAKANDASREAHVQCLEKMERMHREWRKMHSDQYDRGYNQAMLDVPQDPGIVEKALVAILAEFDKVGAMANAPHLRAMLEEKIGRKLVG